MDGYGTISIAVAVVCVVALLVVFYMRKPKDTEGDKDKDPFEGANYGWTEQDFMHGYSTTIAPASGARGLCSRNLQQACHVTCNEFPQGMAHTRCLERCVAGDL